MTSPDDLRRIFDEAATLKNNDMREQLAFRHMVALADTFEGWAMDVRMTPARSAKLLGWAESLRQLADLVGSDWNPPERVARVKRSETRGGLSMFPGYASLHPGAG